MIAQALAWLVAVVILSLLAAHVVLLQLVLPKVQEYDRRMVKGWAWGSFVAAVLGLPLLTIVAL